MEKVLTAFMGTLEKLVKTMSEQAIRIDKLEKEKEDSSKKPLEPSKEKAQEIVENLMK